MDKSRLDIGWVPIRSPRILLGFGFADDPLKEMGGAKAEGK